MNQENWFKNWFNSPEYHALYSNRDDGEANEFIKNIINQIQPKKHCKMLDVACGKGRHSRALAEFGYDVTGIDLAEQSIQEAKQFETDNLQFFTHDMRLPFWINYFDVAFNLFTSFGYFKTQREHNNAIRTIAQSLSPNGLFIIDYLNVHYQEKHLQKFLEKKVSDTTFQITKWHTETHFIKQIQIVHPKNGIPRHLSTERVAKFSLGDFVEMLGFQNLQIQDVFGNYNLSKYDLNESPRMIIIAKKMSFK